MHYARGIHNTEDEMKKKLTGCFQELVYSNSLNYMWIELCTAAVYQSHPKYLRMVEKGLRLWGTLDYLCLGVASTEGHNNASTH